MDKFSKISFQEISKHDMLMIIKALEYTGKNTDISSFIELKNDILTQLSSLTNTSEEEVITYLENNF